MKKCSVFSIFIFLVIWSSVACQVYKNPVQIIEEKRLRNAVRIHPVHELAYVRLAQYLESHGRYTETFSVLRVGQQRIPDAIALVRLEGGLFQGLGYYNDSQKFYSAQISKHPDEALLYLDRAQLYWRMEKQQLALADAQKAITLQADLFEAHYLTGVILSRKTPQIFRISLKRRWTRLLALVKLMSVIRISGYGFLFYGRELTIFTKQNCLCCVQLNYLRNQCFTCGVLLFCRKKS